jgi:hypothetical protein
MKPFIHERQVPCRSEVGVQHEYKFTYNSVKRDCSSILYIRSEVGVKHEYKFTYNSVKRDYSSILYIYTYIYICKTGENQEKGMYICLYRHI